MSTENAETVVSEVDIDNLDDIFGTGSASVMTPGEDGEAKDFFARPGKEIKEFFDKPPAEHKEELDNEKPPEETPAGEGDKPAAAEDDKPAELTPEAIAAALDPDAVIEPGDDDKNNGGRPTTMVAVAKQLFEKNLIKPFDGEEDFSKYKEQDFIELFEMNAKNSNEAMQKDVETAFFEGLSPRLKQAYHYVAQGGQDEIALFQALAASEEMRQLDITTEDGQESAVRQYYQATNYGTAQEIETEINKLKDRGELDEKAGRFKPKLDQMQEGVVQQKLQQQEAQNKQKHNQMQGYMDSVYDVLEKGTINNLELDVSVQNMIYDGLVNPKYPSISGKSTNLLGALLEKYQWTEPNHELVAEALYLLADPDGYRAKVREVAKKETVAETVRTLKTEASASKSGSTGVAEEPDNNKRVIDRGAGIQRKKNDFFKRK